MTRVVEERPRWVTWPRSSPAAGGVSSPPATTDQPDLSPLVGLSEATVRAVLEESDDCGDVWVTTAMFERAVGLVMNAVRSMERENHTLSTVAERDMARRLAEKWRNRACEWRAFSNPSPVGYEGTERRMLRDIEDNHLPWEPEAGQP